MGSLQPHSSWTGEEHRQRDQKGAGSRPARDLTQDGPAGSSSAGVGWGAALPCWPPRHRGALLWAAGPGLGHTPSSGLRWHLQMEGRLRMPHWRPVHARS